MTREYNCQAFSPEEVEEGLLQDLLDYLLSYNKKAKSMYYDIHITSDGYCTIVEWTDVTINGDLGPEGKFEYVPDNGQIMLEYSFPDNHYEQFYSEEEYKERLQEWLKENPGWVKTEYGTWTNTMKNEKEEEFFERLKQQYPMPLEKNSDD